jgi:hypothetical protein
LISWWLYPDDHEIEAMRGAPIPERQGRLLYMARVSNQIIMCETREEVHRIIKDQIGIAFPIEAIRSITFVAGKLFDNSILMQSNPGYLGNLLGLSESGRAQLLDGRWITIDNDELKLYSNSAISDIFSNFVARGATRHITADIAFEGADRFVIAIWEGWVLVELRVFPKSMGDDVLSEINKAAKDWRVSYRNIAFDATGVGGAYKGFLRNSIAVVLSSAPMAERPKVATNKNTAEPKPYFNLRSQLYFLFRDILENSEVLIADKKYRNEVEQELRAIKKMAVPGEAKLRIIPNDQIKQAIGRSPDFAVAITMRCVFDLIPVAQKTKRTVKSY